MIIDGGVYDVTSYISGHPGGSSMVSYCGTNATTIFASIHSQTGYNVLDGYKIGVIGTPTPVCTSNWSTGAWSACVGGSQTRTVNDLNICGITAGKPVTTQSCMMYPANNTTIGCVKHRGDELHNNMSKERLGVCRKQCKLFFSDEDREIMNECRMVCNSEYLMHNRSASTFRNQISEEEKEFDNESEED
jgi:hypothetical protein